MLLRRLRFHPIQVCLSTVRVNDFARVLDGNWALFSCLTKDTDGVNGEAFLGREMIHFGVTTKPRLGLLGPVRLFLRHASQELGLICAIFRSRDARHWPIT